MNNKQQQLDALYQQHKSNPQSPLIVDGNTNIIFGEGNTSALIMFVGEAPGRDEDIQGRPFVGRAGQLLNKALQECSLARKDLYITNIIKVRPTNNRTPTPQEIERCWPVLEQQIALIQPRVICTLGSCATLAFLKKPLSISKIHGYAFPFGQSIIVPIYHPAYILRAPQEYPKFLQDIRFASQIIFNLTKDDSKKV